MAKKVVVANDHGAVEITAKLVESLKSWGFEVNYIGVKEPVSVDYPDMAEAAVNEFRKGGYDFGVLCCGTGIGISISANKMKGVRCALPQNIFAATMAREHNRANFIAFGGRIDYSEDPVLMLKAFVDAVPPDDESRHARRIAKMMSLEDK